MTMWYGGNGWGWCSTIAHIPTMVILWAVVLTTAVLAVGFAIRQRNDGPAPTGTGSVQPQSAGWLGSPEAMPKTTKSGAD